jgi:Ca2+-transporting ATPase
MTTQETRNVQTTVNASSPIWHALAADEACAALDVDSALGLSHEEVARRQSKYGKNLLTPPKRQSAIVRFLLQFHQPLVYILIAAALITAALGEWIDAIVIAMVVVVNSVIGFVQENKALQAIDGLLNSMKTMATVRRGGEKILVDAVELVPGDVVLLTSGDKVPADIRILELRDMQADESALTGESVPSAKTQKILPADTSLADRVNMAYASSAVTYGSCVGVVVATGDATEVGAISTLLSTTEKLETPLTRKIKKFSGMLLYVILGLAAVTFAIGVLQGRPAFDMFLAAVSLMVGMIPEGLPATITIMLALGVNTMARRNAIIRKLPAVETLGSVTVVCSDKTGTLTENQMTVQQIVAAGATYDASGIGYAPQGHFIAADGATSEVGAQEFFAAHPHLYEILRIGALCNDSMIAQNDAGYWGVEGDPTEGALLVSARKAGLLQSSLMKEYPRLDSIPFESTYQYMATLHKTPAGEVVAYIKGSVEALSERCNKALRSEGAVEKVVEFDAASVHEQTERLAEQGLRTLAFAKKVFPASTTRIDHADIASDLTFVGLQGMIDPPREEVKFAVQKCHEAGIAVKMITGDHATTAAVIAAQIGLSGAMRNDKLIALTGKEIAAMSEEELFKAAQSVAVFARVTPEQKLRIVEALQHHNHIVAMTGDGVNDAPALRRADVGIAMGIAGTDVAKDAADMVLADDNFVSIEAAIEEGRTVFGNLMKFIVWTIPTNLGEGLIILLSIALMSSLPMLPIHVLWLNMSTALCLGLMLAFEPKEPNVMQRPPRRPDKPILTLPLIMRTLFVGTMMFIAGYGLFHWEMMNGENEAAARTAAVTVFVMIEAFYLLNCRSLIFPMWHVGLWSNPLIFVGIAAMLTLQLLFVNAPFMNRLFHTAPLSLGKWAMIVAIAAVVYVLVALEKYIRMRALLRRSEKAVPAP